jgi:hypothetical protein
LLNQFERLVPYDPRLPTEKALLLLDSGKAQEAYDLLAEAILRLPAATGPAYAFARAGRQLALEQSDAAKQNSLINSWRLLDSLESRSRPLELLGEGRTWLACRDGTKVDDEATRCFKRLHLWVSEHLPQEQGDLDKLSPRPEEIRDVFPLPRSAPLEDWWSREIQAYVFGNLRVNGADGDYLDVIRGRLESFAVDTDALEEDFSNHLISSTAAIS